MRQRYHSRCERPPYIMPGGKYAGHLVGDVPTGYLAWAWTEWDGLPERVRECIRGELAVRLGLLLPELLPAWAFPQVPADLATMIVDAGRVALAKRLHPDRGGDGVLLARVNDTADRLRDAFAGRREGRAA